MSHFLTPSRRARVSADEVLESRVIRTERLALRPHRPADAEAWYRIQSDPAVVRYLPWPLRDRRESRRHLRTRMRKTRLQKADDFLAFAVDRDGTLIGDVSLHLRIANRESRTVEIGWIISPDVAGHGYAAEAAQALIDLVFAELRAKLILAVIDRRNAPSIALARRLGFRLAGREGALLLAELGEDVQTGVEEWEEGYRAAVRDGTVPNGRAAYGGRAR